VKKEIGMQRLLIELRKRRRNQKGFTLIEMLVVISILGILAAIVTMSMVGVANLAQSRANDAEMRTVQVALDTMANEQGLDQNSVCPAGMATTDDMGAFPAGASNSNVGGTGAVPLYPRYIRSPQHTKRKYTCDQQGNVTPGP
jgi:prepilin-type N-terminal cleavage/methylation domain-containing protein